MKTTGLRGVICGTVALVATALLAGTSHAETAHPDFTGVWTNAGAPGIGGATRTAPAPLPFKPEAQARVKAFEDLMKPTGDSTGGWCLGYGMPGSMLNSGGYPMEIIQRPDQLTIIYEAHGEMRHVYLGTRNLPQADRIPGRNGYSSAHWEGKTLVVETDNLVDQVDQRYAHSDEATVVERYHLEAARDAQGRRVLVADMTMTDPKFYTAPVTAQKKWAEIPNGHLLPYECAEEVWTHHLEEMAKKAGVPVP
jgi:hypothetical protein